MANLTDFSLAYITASGMDEAKLIAKHLLERHLASCVNIVENMTSYFWWEGQVSKAQEVLVIAKTRTSKMPELTEAVKSKHSYECPCVLEVPVGKGGNPEYRRWLLEQLHH